jgi:hypothetical protein
LLSIVSCEPTNFTAAEPNVLDICASSEPDAMKMFSQISLPEMSTDHDLVSGVYHIFEVLEGPAHPVVLDDIYVHICSPIYETSNPEAQIQHFISIFRRLLDAHVPLRDISRRM